MKNANNTVRIASAAIKTSRDAVRAICPGIGTVTGTVVGGIVSGLGLSSLFD